MCMYAKRCYDKMMKRPVEVGDPQEVFGFQISNTKELQLTEQKNLKTVLIQSQDRLS